ncbi:MAG: hypothetical protein L6Q68_14495 [Aquabacterium sp.]|nr:hypothetical protein [Aquabacterium sp.]
MLRFLAAMAVAASITSGAASQSVRSYPADAMCAQEQLCRRCDGPACLKVASPAAWPEGVAGGTTTPFHLGPFRLRLPADPQSIHVLGGGDVIVRYAKDRWIGFSLQTATAAGLPLRDDPVPAIDKHPAGTLAFADVPRVIFTKTPDDAEPRQDDDRRIWRSALTSKHAALERTTEMSIATRGPLTLYLADGGVADLDGVAYVAHRSLRDGYLYVNARGFAFAEFRRVAGSIEHLKE